MVSDMCSEAGVNGKKTNHSLRVAGTTSLYEAGVPEKVIQQCTGHPCLESLRTYERVLSDQEMAVSRILAGEEKSYRESLENVSTTSVTKQSTVDACKPSTPGVNCSNCTVNFYSGRSVPLPIHPFYQFNPYATYASGNPPFDPTSFNMSPFDQTNVPFSDHHDEQN